MSEPSIEQLWSSDAVVWRLARTALIPASWIFAAATSLRNRLYDLGVFGVERVDVPIICVGNLRVGGSGKTPLVMWLVGRLLERGRRPVVVSRGYRAAPSKLTIVASSSAASAPAGATLLDADAPAGGDAADEAVLVARRMGVPVVSSADRAAACRTASAVFDADTIVLDDGFQHRRLHRDLDLVIVDAADRRAHRLPAGPLREGLAALGRADFVVDTGRAAASGRTTMVAAPEALVARVSADAACEPLERLRGARVVAVAGIARPQRFFEALRALGASVVEAVSFADHHEYSTLDWTRVKRLAGTADLVVTTEKDLVKLEALLEGDTFAARVFALRHGVTVEGGEAIVERIAQFDAKAGQPHHHAPGEAMGEG